MLTKSMFENIKCGINCRRASPFLLKYYISKIGGADSADSGEEVQNYEKHADIILERSLIGREHKNMCIQQQGESK